MARARSLSRSISATSEAIELELALVADALDELDLHFAPVEVSVETEEMNFEQWRAVIVDRRPGPEAGDSWKGAPLDPRHDRINSVREPVRRLERYIGRWNAERASKALAVNDLASNRIVAPQAARRRRDVALLESLSNGARGHDAGRSSNTGFDFRHDLNGEAMSQASFGEGGRRT